jgi:hypothetical protein
MIREAGGWAIAPGVSTTGNYDNLAKTTGEELDRVFASFNQRKEELSKRAAERFLDRFVAARPKADGSVGEKEAGDLVESFREHLRKGELLEAFGCCALLDPVEGSWEALKALSYEHKGATGGRVPDQLLKVAARDQWAAVSMRLDSGFDTDPIYPMYLVVATEAGPRIVVDVGLRLATLPVREVLNSRVWKRIEKQLEEKETALVRSLFQGHVERSKTDLAEWEKSIK